MGRTSTRGLGWITFSPLTRNMGTKASWVAPWPYEWLITKARWHKGATPCATRLLDKLGQGMRMQ